MSIMDLAAWSVIIGLSFIAVGGLLLWAYGESIKTWLQRINSDSFTGLRQRKQFTGLIIYSVIMIVLGIGGLIQGTYFVLN